MSDEIKRLNEQLIDIQSQLAFQEDTISALNDVVTRQQQQMENLQELLNSQKSQIETLAAEGGDISEPPPPHY